MTIFFALSVFFWIVTRIYSAVKIWDRFRKKAERARKWRVFRTLFDVEIFEILHLSHTLGLKGKSTPQRLLDLITAVFEAAPEVQSSFQSVNTSTFSVNVSLCVLSRHFFRPCSN